MDAATRADVRKALAIVWAVVSLATLVVLALPFVVSPARIQATLPTCESRVRYGVPCPSCGLTTGFIALSAGDVTRARAANAAAPLLYGLFVLNGVAFLLAAPGLFRRLTCKS